MRIIFVRHGQTTFNLESRYQGHTDAKLSKLGIEQARAVAKRLRSEKVEAVYSSDLSRAVDTAKEIAAFHDICVNTDPRLRECKFGDWEGLTVAEISERYADLYANYLRDSVAFRAPNGERLEQMQERTVQAVNEICQNHPVGNVVVVTHGGPIRAFICHALGTSLHAFRSIRLDNCGITILSKEANSRWFLEVMNDVCHLNLLETTRYYHDETCVQGRHR